MEIAPFDDLLTFWPGHRYAGLGVTFLRDNTMADHAAAIGGTAVLCNLVLREGPSASFVILNGGFLIF